MKGMLIMIIMNWEKKAEQLVDTRYPDIIIRLMKVDYKYIVNSFSLIILRAENGECCEANTAVEENCTKKKKKTISAFVDMKNNSDAVKAIIAFSKAYEASLHCIEDCRALLNAMQ